VKAYEAALEEASGGEAAAPAVIVGIAYHETREHKKEVDGKIAVVYVVYYGQPAGKGESFMYVIPEDEERRDASESVEKLIMGLGVGVCSRSHCAWCSCLGHVVDCLILESLFAAIVIPLIQAFAAA